MTDPDRAWFGTAKQVGEMRARLVEATALLKICGSVERDTPEFIDRVEAFLSRANAQPAAPRVLPGFAEPTETDRARGDYGIGFAATAQPYAEDQQPAVRGPLAQAFPLEPLYEQPATPEPVSGQWRVGARVPEHIYDGAGRPLVTMPSAELAARVVAAVNAQPVSLPPDAQPGRIGGRDVPRPAVRSPLAQAFPLEPLYEQPAAPEPSAALCKGMWEVECDRTLAALERAESAESQLAAVRNAIREHEAGSMGYVSALHAIRGILRTPPTPEVKP